MDRQSRPKRFNCTACKYSCRCRRDLVEHFRQHTGEKPNKCSCCDFATAYLSSLCYHIRTKHPGVKPLKCGECGEAFVTGIQLRRHSRLHTKYMCTTDTAETAKKIRNNRKSCARFRSRISRKKCQQPGRSDPYRCMHCDYCTVDRHHFESHLRRHNGEKSYRCKACAYSAAYMQALYSHIRQRHPDLQTFRCAVCSKGFVTRKGLARHALYHADDRRGNDRTNHSTRGTTDIHGNVDRKGSLMTRSSRLVQHRRGQPAEKPYRCTVCDYSCTKRSVLAAHYRSHTGEKPFKCTVCEYATGYSGMFYDHMRKKHPGTKQFQCTVCGVGFVTPRQLMHHLKSHIGRPGKGDTRTNATSALRVNHDTQHGSGNIGGMSTGTQEEPTDGVQPAWLLSPETPPALCVDQQCDVCSKRFATEAKLSRHLREVHVGAGSQERGPERRTGHEKQKRIKRHQNKDNRKQGGRLLTQRRHRRVTGKAYRCTECEYITQYSKAFNDHWRRHTGEKPFKCTVCDYAARQLSQLYCHMRTIHPDTKPFKCLMCQNAFVTPTELRHHSCLHTKTSISSSPLKERTKGASTARSRKGTSTQCSHFTSHRSKLFQRARRRASKDTPYNCTVCDHSTSSRANIVKHFRVHTKERPYKCLICDYASAWTSALHSHIRTVHPGTKPFTCTVCDAGFVTPRQLRHHLQFHIEEVRNGTNMAATSIMGVGYDVAGGPETPGKHCGELVNNQIHQSFAAGDSPGEPLVLSNGMHIADGGILPMFDSTLQCDVCKKQFDTPAKLSRHLRQVHIGSNKNIAHGLSGNPKPQPTKNVQQNQEQLARRISQSPRRSRGDKPYKCTICEYSTARMSDLSKHARRHTIEKPHKCSKCRYTTKYVSALYYHIRKFHPGTKNHRCNMCNQAFVTPTELKKHSKECNSALARRCRNVDSVNMVNTSPKKHQRHRAHLVSKRPNRKPYKCTVCGYSTFREGELTKHTRRHALKNIHKCSKCHYASKYISDLYKHLRNLHPGTKVHKCIVCHRVFATLRQLKQHSRACKPTLSQRSRTNRVQRGKRYTCTECAYSSNIKSSLDKHALRHTGERPYKCTLCSYAAASVSTLYNHMRKKHPSYKPFKCTVCGEGFVTPTLLKQHLKMHIVGQARSPAHWLSIKRKT